MKPLTQDRYNIIMAVIGGQETVMASKILANMCCPARVIGSP